LGKAFGKVIFNPFLKIAVSCKMTIYTKFLTPSLSTINEWIEEREKLSR